LKFHVSPGLSCLSPPTHATYTVKPHLLVTLKLAHQVLATKIATSMRRRAEVEDTIAIDVSYCLLSLLLAKLASGS
jgi:hypothetical protein